jgi:hypothetical protein
MTFQIRTAAVGNILAKTRRVLFGCTEQVEALGYRVALTRFDKPLQD